MGNYLKRSADSKTFWTGAGSIIAAIGAYMMGLASPFECLTTIQVALGTMFVRDTVAAKAAA